MTSTMTGATPRRITTAATSRADRLPLGLPPRWIDSVLPAELPHMARAMVGRIRDEIPEYRRALDGPYSRDIRQSTEAALTGFSRQYLHTGTLNPETELVFRDLGRREALEGRSSDVLQAAFRAGSMAAWQRILTACEREPLSAEAVGVLAARVFGFADHIGRLAAEGYAAAHNDDTLVQARLRARLARMIVAGPDTPAEAIGELASRLGWVLPYSVVVLELLFDEGEPFSLSSGAMSFGPNALVEVEPGCCVVVLPAPADLSSVHSLVAATPGARVSAGCTLPLAEAGQSLRWAKLASRLRHEGTLPDTPVTVCDQHVPLLLVHAGPGIAELLIARRLSPLLGLPAARRLKFARLLSAWLEYGGSQAELAETLGTHRQTLHYRVGRLQAMFGEQLDDNDARLEIMLALRAALPVWERTADPASR